MKYVLIKKRDIKDEKRIAPMAFGECLKKSEVSENSKIYYGQFLRNGLYTRYYYIRKSRCDVQYLEVW